jgi:hypothetical protein
MNGSGRRRSRAAFRPGPQPAPCRPARLRLDTRHDHAHRPFAARRGTPAPRPRLPRAAVRREGGPRRAQRDRQDDPVPRHHRRPRHRDRHHRPAAQCAHRAGGAGSARHRGAADRDRAEGRQGTFSASGRGGDGDRCEPDRRDPHAAGRHRRPFRRGAGGDHPRRARLRRGGAAASRLLVLRRLAHARGAGGGAVLGTRPAAARRADQLSRPRRHALARDLRLEISAHRAS